MLRARRSGGFSLLEVILALVILSAALSGIYSLINTDLISLRRAEAVVASRNALEEAVRQIRLVQLSDGQEGRVEIGEHSVVWRAELVEPVTVGRGQSGVVGAYDLGLFDIWLTVESVGRGLAEWHTRVVQHDFVRPPPEAVDV